VALSTDDLNAVRAQWEEWVPDGYRLDIEVKAGPTEMQTFHSRDGHMAVRAQHSLYCQVEVLTYDGPWAPYRIVFSERVPHDAAALRASVTVLARTIAQHQLPAVEEEGG
jgi:hypothetical protein